MKTVFLSMFILCSSISMAQLTGTNTAIHQQEEVQKKIESNRQEVNNASVPANSPSAPTKVDTSTWGIDSNVRFEITNHLFGYSMIKESEQTLQGVKITGLLNLAYYKAEKKSATGRSQGRLVFGFEFPVYEISNRFTAFSGLGLTLGDRKAFYADAGVDFRIFEWFKIQAGVNWNTSYGSIAPQVSAGLVW